MNYCNKLMLIIRDLCMYHNNYIMLMLNAHTLAGSHAAGLVYSSCIYWN